MNAPVCVVCDGRIGCEFCPGGYVPQGEDFCPEVPEFGVAALQALAGNLTAVETPTPWDEVSVRAWRPWA